MSDSRSVGERLASVVLEVHRRNGGTLTNFDPDWRLLEPVLRLDSLDLAELMVRVEKEFGVSPFEAATPPRTWGELTRLLEDHGSSNTD